VVRDVLRDECDALNAHWFRYITAHRPFVTLKAAVSLDGRLATRTGDSHWVSGAEARALVHQLRDRVDAVLVGAGTARSDDPRLTTRLPRGRGRDPLRIVLDTGLTLPPTLKLFRQRSEAPTIVAHASRGTRELGRNVELLRCRRAAGGVDLRDLLRRLGARGVTHLLVEGGAAVHGSFLRAGLVDRVALFVSPRIVGGDGLGWVGGAGVARMADALRLEDLEVEQVGEDLLLTGEPAGALASRRGRD
jgi:diaminohydroxyphosphoribosylaminopyrimidine deaminase/5-amino-6-(5-phosphoribosylamino)uracil reductase